MNTLVSESITKVFLNKEERKRLLIRLEKRYTVPAAGLKINIHGPTKIIVRKISQFLITLVSIIRDSLAIVQVYVREV